MKTNISKCFRLAIEQDMCQIRKGKNDHIHHSSITFAEIVSDFIFWEGLPRLPLSQDMKLRFREYHKQVSNLVVINKEKHKKIHSTFP